jgi:hypothetical protein
MRYSAESSAVWRYAAQDCDAAGWNRRSRAAQQIFADEIGEGIRSENVRVGGLARSFSGSLKGSLRGWLVYHSQRYAYLASEHSGVAGTCDRRDISSGRAGAWNRASGGHPRRRRRVGGHRVEAGRG